jgi:hypothetical protein
MRDTTAVLPYDLSEFARAQSLWQRFRFYCDNGHAAYIERYRRNQRYFDGDGGQWNDIDRAYMEGLQGRKCFEINLLKQAVLTAIGEQISTQTDITLKATKGKSSAETAKVLSKVLMHILGENDYHSKETAVWASGLIAERGYLDARMDYEGNVGGEIKIVDVDSSTVIPDIFATEYNPKEWPGFVRFMWLSIDQIEGMYGYEARQKAEKDYQYFQDRPFSDEFTKLNDSDDNYGMATSTGVYQWFDKVTGELRLRVLERQYHEPTECLHYINPSTGDKEQVPARMKLAEAQAFAAENGLVVQKMRGKQVKWLVTTATSVLFDDVSPYRSFTIIPFFYLFTKGKTGCMVTDGISPQDLLNKATSAEVHYLTSLSNSGWIVQKGKMVNMTTPDLERVGMKTGLVIEVDGPIGECLQKIQPNTFPTGMDRMADKGEQWVKATTGMSDPEQGKGMEISGISYAMQTFQAKLQLAMPLANLDLTRTFVARKCIELIQDFYTDERIFKITGTDDYGRPTEETVTINQVDPAGNVLNDITVGEYEVAVSNQPTAATYEEGQFRQIESMRKGMNVAIPDDEVVRRSNLSNKNELADRMASPQDGGLAAAQAKKLEQEILNLQAEVEVKKAQAQKLIADKAETNVQAMFGAINAGKVIAMLPSVAPLADELMLSAGFIDSNAAPVIPQDIPGIDAGAMQSVKGTPFVPGVVPNTSPNFPPIAASGAEAGIEGGAMPPV